MASRRSMNSNGKPKLNYIYPASEIAADYPESSTNLFEFNEVDIWTPGKSPSMESRKIFPISKKLPKRSGSAVADKTVKASSSLPVNIPDWSKILQTDRSTNMGKEVEDSDDDDDEIGKVPPHEYLARRRGDSFSVHEGIGRTLKGRDLRRVRNAIWKKTGFED